MAHNKIGLQVKGFDEYMDRLDRLGGSDAMKRAVESALKASKQYVNPQLEAAMTKSKLPAGGKYSRGGTKASIDKELTVKWSGITGMTGEINIGFDFKKSGLKSIFLMYGTPRMKPVSGLKNAIYGAKSQKQIIDIQAEALNKVIEDIMEG